LVPTRYLLRSTLEIIGYYVLVTGLICLIYLIEKFSALVGIALEHHFDAGTFLSLMLFTLPAMVDLALPLSCLGSIYFCLLNARERREMLIFAGAGVGPALIGLTVVIAAVCALLLSLVFSGFVKPAANYSFRLTQQLAENQVLSKGIPGGAFYAQDGKVLYARSIDETPLRAIRLFEFSDNRLDRMIFSNCAAMSVGDGLVNAELCDAHIYMLQSGDTPLADPDVVEVNAGPTRYEFSMSSVFGAPSQGHAPELGLIELARLGWHKKGGYSEAAFSRLLGALTCLVAAAVAVICVAFTGPGTRLFAFPAACACVMAVAILNNTLASAFGALANLSVLMASGIVAAVIATLVTVGLVHGYYDRLVIPRMAKT
jgi:lipopolysaccharide export LptBFGC system permease protein LptF